MAEVNFLRPHQVDSLKEDIKSAKATLQDPHNQLDDRGAVAKRLRSLEQKLEREEPPTITKQQEDRLVKMKRDIEKRVVDGMPSHEEMRRAPHGALGKHQRWERRNKRWVQRLRNINLTLTKGAADSDAANIEGLRPRESTIGMHSAIIGKDASAFSFPSEQFQSRYDEIDWSAHRDGGDGIVDPVQARANKADEFISALDGGVSSLRESLSEMEEDERLTVAADAAEEAGAKIPESLNVE